VGIILGGSCVKNVDGNILLWSMVTSLSVFNMLYQSGKSATKNDTAVFFFRIDSKSGTACGCAVRKWLFAEYRNYISP
jgi:hypothetical protein